MNLYICKESNTVVEKLYSDKECCLDENFRQLKVVDYTTLKEKHVPVLSYENGKLHVEIGSIPHPMLVEHYIPFVEVCYDNYVLRKNLQPGQSPSADFDILNFHGTVKVRIYCNIHGLWSNEITI